MEQLNALRMEISAALTYRPECIIAIRDNRGATIDRYTVVIEGPLGAHAHVVASAEQARGRGILEVREGNPDPFDDDDIEWSELPEPVRQATMRAVGEVYERKELAWKGQ